MFDANGDLVTKFDIFQGQKIPKGIFHLVHVGIIDPQASSENKMMVHLKEDIQVSCLDAEMTLVCYRDKVTEKFKVYVKHTLSNQNNRTGHDSCDAGTQEGQMFKVMLSFLLSLRSASET